MKSYNSGNYQLRGYSPPSTSYPSVLAAFIEWGDATSPPQARAAHHNLQREERTEDHRAEFHRALNDVLSLLTPSLFDDVTLDKIWANLHAEAPKIGFVLACEHPTDHLGQTVVIYVAGADLERHGYFSGTLVAGKRDPSAPEPPPRLPRRLGTDRSGAPAVRCIWVTCRERSEPLESDLDNLLDALGKPRQATPGGTPWYRVDLDVSECGQLCIPTALDALPPFSPASSGSATGLTVGLSGVDLPELIARPQNLPDRPRLKYVGRNQKSRTRDEFANAILAR